MKRNSLFSLLMGFVLMGVACTSQPAPQSQVESDFAFADQQLRVALQAADSMMAADGTSWDGGKVFPRTLTPTGELVMVDAPDWTSGFFPGELWYMYEYTQDPFWLEKAQQYTEALESERYNTTTHDLGFMLYCSYGNGNRLAADSAYVAVMVDGAKSLASRFNPTVGLIRSWDNWGGDFKWDFPVIIDNMMNLEFLFWATKVTGDSTFYNIATTHADTTMANHFRADNSSFHVVDYDTITGKAIMHGTHQGYSDASAWSRGQAWGLYGYTVCYRETGEARYLEQAEKIADFIFSHENLPEDLIPYWDYDAPATDVHPRDVSAATITASALYELAGYAAEGNNYRELADTILANLSANYLNEVGSEKGFLLRSSTGHIPGNVEIDVPLCYADYYFLEALLRKRALDAATAE